MVYSLNYACINILRNISVVLKLQKNPRTLNSVILKMYGTMKIIFFKPRDFNFSRAVKAFWKILKLKYYRFLCNEMLRTKTRPWKCHVSIIKLKLWYAKVVTFRNYWSTYIPYLCKCNYQFNLTQVLPSHYIGYFNNTFFWMPGDDFNWFLAAFTICQ